MLDDAHPGLPILAYNCFCYSPYGCEFALAGKLEAEKDAGIYLIGAAGKGASRLDGPGAGVNVSWSH